RYLQPGVGGTGPLDAGRLAPGRLAGPPSRARSGKSVARLPCAPLDLASGDALDVLAVEAHADARTGLRNGLDPGDGFQRLVDEVLVPVAGARRGVARQAEVRQRREVQVGCAPHAALEHATAPHRHAEGLGDVVDSQGPTEAPDAPDLHVDDAACAYRQRLARVLR